MNYLVVGAGNASRPVARLLNYLGHKVIMTDLKEMSEFKPIYQTWLHKMDEEGVILDLKNPNPTLDGIEAVYVPPTLPSTAPIAKLIDESDVKILTNEEFSQMINDLVSTDIIGITGSMGKTTTTTLITSVFKGAGYNVWSCSSLANNLVSETIIDGIVTGKADECDIAVFELPHGSLGLLDQLNIKIGVLSYLTPEHLNEFEGSYEKYQKRKLIMQDICETFIANAECMRETDLLREDTIFYALDKDVDFKGTMGDKELTIEYGDRKFKTPFYMMSYFFENAVGAAAVGINYGLSEEDIINLKNVLEDRFGRVTDEMVIYMHEEWFEKQAKILGVKESKQTKNFIEVILPINTSLKIDGEKLFFDAYDINKNFKFSYKDKKIHIILDTTKNEKHFIYYLNELFDKIIKEIEKN